MRRPVLDITSFFFRVSTQVKAEVRRVQMRKKKAVISNTGNFFCLNNNVSNLYNNSVVEKTNGMAFNPNTTLKLIYWFIYHQWSIPVRSQVFSVRVTLQGIKSRSHAHPHYSHNNTKIDELENFSEDNKTGLTERVILFRVTERNETKHGRFSACFHLKFAIYFLIKAEIIDIWYGNPTSHVNTFSSSSKCHHSIAPLLSKIVWRNICGPKSCQFSSVCLQTCKYDPPYSTKSCIFFFVWRAVLSLSEILQKIYIWKYILQGVTTLWYNIHL